MRKNVDLVFIALLALMLGIANLFASKPVNATSAPRRE